MPMTALVLGAAAWAAQSIGGDVRGGAISFAIMAVYAVAVFAFSTRSDVAAVLSGNSPDERYRAMEQQALAATGLMLIVYVIAGFLWEQAHGRSGMPYTLMGAAAGLTYLGWVVYGRLRG